MEMMIRMKFNPYIQGAVIAENKSALNQNLFQSFKNKDIDFFFTNLEAYHIIRKKYFIR